MYINILGDVYAQFSVPRERTIRDTSEAVRSRLVGEGRLPLPLPLPPPLLPPPSHPHSSLACSLFARPVTDVKEIVNGKEPRTKHARAIIDNGGVLSKVLPPFLPPSLPATAATIPFPSSPPSLSLFPRAKGFRRSSHVLYQTLNRMQDERKRRTLKMWPCLANKASRRG